MLCFHLSVVGNILTKRHLADKCKIFTYYYYCCVVVVVVAVFLFLAHELFDLTFHRPSRAFCHFDNVVSSSPAQYSWLAWRIKPVSERSTRWRWSSRMCLYVSIDQYTTLTTILRWWWWWWWWRPRGFWIVQQLSLGQQMGKTDQRSDQQYPGTQ